jgi:hypothetical protein
MTTTPDGLVLLPAWCTPRRADANEVIGAALGGQGCPVRAPADSEQLRRPVSTVRRWLRAARDPHTQWLRHSGLDHAGRLDAAVLAEINAQPTPLTDALTALAAAVTAYQRRVARPVAARTLIGLLPAGGRCPPGLADQLHAAQGTAMSDDRRHRAHQPPTPQARPLQREHRTRQTDTRTCSSSVTAT